MRHKLLAMGLAVTIGLSAVIPTMAVELYPEGWGDNIEWYWFYGGISNEELAAWVGDLEIPSDRTDEGQMNKFAEDICFLKRVMFNCGFEVDVSSGDTLHADKFLLEDARVDASDEFGKKIQKACNIKLELGEGIKSADYGILATAILAQVQRDQSFDPGEYVDSTVRIYLLDGVTLASSSNAQKKTVPRFIVCAEATDAEGKQMWVWQNTPNHNRGLTYKITIALPDDVFSAMMGKGDDTEYEAVGGYWVDWYYDSPAYFKEQDQSSRYFPVEFDRKNKTITLTTDFIAAFEVRVKEPSAGNDWSQNENAGDNGSSSNNGSSGNGSSNNGSSGNSEGTGSGGNSEGTGSGGNGSYGNTGSGGMGSSYGFLTGGGNSGRSERSSAYGTSGSWEKDGKRWRFAYQSGIYASNKWEKADGKWYYFNADGYMATGWQLLNGVWYHLNEANGGMDTGWYQDTSDGFWYLLNEDGSMKTGWQLVNGKYYYLTNAAEPSYSYDEAAQAWVYSTAGKRPYGSMYVNEKTPDGYMVDENGAWIE